MVYIYGPKRELDLQTWLRSLFQWRVVGDLGIWRYEENVVTGRRRAIKLCTLHGVANVEWIEGGPWVTARPRPPRTGSGVQPPD